MIEDRIPKTTAEAARLKAGAERKRALADALAPSDPTGARWNRLEATDMDAHADAFLTLPLDQPEVGAGGEMVPVGADARDRIGLVDTVRSSPDLITTRASCERLDIAAKANALDLAVDAAQTIQAQNSLEKMLAHQLAAAHKLAMQLTGRAAMHCHSASHDGFRPTRQEYHAVESARAANSAARMMDVFQRGLLTLQRLRSGGEQVVTGQHVTVSGGQAVVAGTVERGSGRRAGSERK